jgi:hypothetical protein
MDLTTIVQLVGLAAIVIASRQLVEARRRRRFDTYWQFFTVYSSEDYRCGREAIAEIGREIGVDRRGQENQIAELAKTYVAKFHSSGRADRPAEEESRVSEIDKRARLRVRFFNTAGAVIHRRLVDVDLLLELIGPAFNRDYEIIRVFVEGNREAHNLRVYGDVELLKERYDRWEKRHRRRDQPDAHGGHNLGGIV